MSKAEPKILFCKQCRAPKVSDREYCCYCVGRYFLKKEPFRIRLAYRFLSQQWKLSFVFYIGYEKQYAQLIPEYLREGVWLNIQEINRPIEVDEK